MFEQSRHMLQIKISKIGYLDSSSSGHSTNDKLINMSLLRSKEIAFNYNNILNRVAAIAVAEFAHRF